MDGPRRAPPAPVSPPAALPRSSPGWEPGGSISLPVLAGLCPAGVLPASRSRENPFTGGSCSPKIKLCPQQHPGCPHRVQLSTQPGQRGSLGTAVLAGISTNHSAGMSLSQIRAQEKEQEHSTSNCTGTLRVCLRGRVDRRQKRRKKVLGRLKGLSLALGRSSSKLHSRFYTIFLKLLKSQSGGGGSTSSQDCLLLYFFFLFCISFYYHDSHLSDIPLGNSSHSTVCPLFCS